MKPTLVINSHSYTEYIEEMEPSSNGLDADGSGRDVTTGLMYRSKVAEKLKYTVKMLRITETLAKQLYDDLSSSEYYTATVLNPKTNTTGSYSFYTQSLPFGTQRYIRSAKKTVYDGITFEMIER